MVVEQIIRDKRLDGFYFFGGNAMVHYFIYQRFQFCLVKRSAFQQNFADGQHFTLADVGDLLRHQAIAVCGSVKLHTLDKSLARCLL